MNNFKQKLIICYHILFGKGRKLPFWRALGATEGKYVYTSNRLYAYRNMKDQFEMEKYEG